MKSFQICPNPFPSLGGPATTYQQFYRSIGTRSIGFLAPDDGLTEKAVVPIEATVRCFGGKGLRGYYYAPESRTRAADIAIADADVVFLHGLFTHPGVWAANACQRRGVPYIVVLHGILDPWALKKTRVAKKLWMHLFGNSILANAASVVCATGREATKALPFLRRAPMTQVISWASDGPNMRENSSGRTALRRSLGFNESDRVLVYLGRLHSMKRPIETIRILAQANKSNLRLLVIGPDGDVTKAKLESAARELSWSGLRVVGPIFGRDKFDYLGAGDGFISLSHRENFNYGLAEAMAVGLPPILSPGNDLGWEFAENGFSWQLTTGDDAEVLTAIDEFGRLTDNQLRARGRAAKEWTEKNLGMSRLKERLEDLVQTTTKHGKRSNRQTWSLASP